MKFNPLPSLEDLNSDLDYCPLTGVLRWKANPSKRRRTDMVGKEVGCINAGGYRVFNYCGKVLYVHRVAFAIHSGQSDIADVEIDHINLNRQDNRAVNLRAALREQNAANAPKHVDNSSGIKGVHFCNTRKVWLGSVMHNGKLRRTHGCPTKEVAAQELRMIRQSLHKEFTNHG